MVSSAFVSPVDKQIRIWSKDFLAIILSCKLLLCMSTLLKLFDLVSCCNTCISKCETFVVAASIFSVVFLLALPDVGSSA